MIAGAICPDHAKAANRAGGAKAEVVVYPDAAHSFDVESDSGFAVT